MPKQRIPTWLLVVLAVVGLILVVPALWVFVSVTATPVHPNPERVPTVLRSAPQPKWAESVEQARRLVRTNVAQQNLPGLSVAVGVDADVVWAEGFGFADLRASVPVTPDHRFRIGTASTALTSVAAGLLLEDGRLKLHDEIQTYVPTFPKKAQAVTLLQLMAHAPGVTPDDNGEAPLFTKHCERPVEAVEHYENWRFFEPETHNPYSIHDWILVSAAIEAVANQPFLAFMQEFVFDPLGMRNTIADPATIEEGEDFPLVNMFRELIHDPAATRGDASGSPEKPADDVKAYDTRFRSDPKYGMHAMRPLDYSCYAGASAFQSTPSDLVRFAMALNGGKLLQPATVDLLQAPQSPGSEGGLDWYTKTVMLAGKPARVIGQDGDVLGGKVATLITLPEHGITVAVTSSISHADTFSIAVKVAEAFASQGGGSKLK